MIPAHLGGSSPIKHVVVIVQENRTYDQVLGDLGEGNGDPADAQFGAQVTPNAHALATRFGDLDNFYDEGTLSADGHNWIVQAEANDYVEKEFGAFYRSYPSQGGDALAYQRDGFLWNAAEKAGLSVQNFGEYIYNPYSLPSSAPDWDQWYAESQWLEDKAAQGPRADQQPVPVREGAVGHPVAAGDHRSVLPELPALDPRPVPGRPVAAGVPAAGAERPDAQPDVHVADDRPHHRQPTCPDPVAQVADNDLAVGRVIDTISHSKFWKSTAIFVVEDDTQNGVDHVDGHRGPAFVVSPYSASGVNDNYYTQLNMVRTIEQILGIPPMNQEDLRGGADVQRVHRSIRTTRRTTSSRIRSRSPSAHPAIRRRSPRRQPAPPRPSARRSARRASCRPTCSRSTRPGRRGARSRRPSTTSTVRTTSTRSR